MGSRWAGLLRDLSQLVRSWARRDPAISYDELRRGELLYRLLAENARDLIWSVEFPDRMTYVSPAAEELLGWSAEEQMARAGGFAMLVPECAERVATIVERAVAEHRSSVAYEAEHFRADGTTLWCEIHMSLQYDEDGKVVSSVGVTRDISKRRHLNTQLLQAQKMEAVGSLAGGIAHDFNNYLTVIIGSLELLAEEVEKAGIPASAFQDALDAADRSASLTRQLLAFSRSQPVQPMTLDVNDLVGRSTDMFRRLAGEHIRLETFPTSEPCWVRADPNQLEQVLMNLFINSRDALDGGEGTIGIRIGRVQVDSADSGGLSLVPGPYVRIEVVDDGRGMSSETRARVFEPFFSTKPRGQGTGLGLPTVRSIVSDLEGDVVLRSRPGGGGTSVCVFLPELPSEGAVRTPRLGHIRGDRESLHGMESILVVEDEEEVGRMARRILERSGYTVTSALRPSDALREAGRRKFGLLLTDLVMPEMSGVDLVRRLREAQPDLRAVVMSGYVGPEDPDSEPGSLPGRLLSKPFHPEELLRAVRGALDEPR